MINAENTVEIHAYWGGTDATQDDVVLGEGQAMVFLTPEEAVAKPVVVRELLQPGLVVDAEERAPDGTAVSHDPT